MYVHTRPVATIGLFTIAEGEAGILQTAQVMRNLVNEYKANPQIRELALSLVRHLPEKDALAEIDALFKYVRDCIRYVGDIYDVETLHTPVELLRVQQGDCDDKSTLLASMLESIGYETAFKLTGYNGREYEHVYVFVRSSIAGVALHLDPTMPEEMGWEAPNATIFKYVQ